ncbi:LON peptidase N-terminal domain and RING finger protein 2 isoform X2 [Esox lucius]|uniref:LON peptidase N-terminal domain and ring finger 2 n=1 Tax=Esox lucius TaxID=8010 RepID=A0A3P8XYS0_ESOLU|nr:LON peptidase N-terminal domain and RING finger protein 2 isoform X2 [Esox lucius]
MDLHFVNLLDHTPHDCTAAATTSSEIMEVTSEAFCAGDYDLSVEIYSSQQADVRHPDRGLSLLKADALSRAGRIAEAVDWYFTAANLERLQANELGTLVDCIAHSLRIKECTNSTVVSEDEQSLDLFSCRLCKCLLTDPVTLECGHTFCKRCIEDDAIKECEICGCKLIKTYGQIKPIGFRVNVVLRSLLDKWFCAESKARRCWLEGERMRSERDFINALEKYNKAVEIAPYMPPLLGRRAELHMAMNNFRQAIEDLDAVCRLKPLSPEAHHAKALALNKAGQKGEALRMYLYCVALKPDWGSVKLEAQAMLSDMFSSVFQRDVRPKLLIFQHRTENKPPCEDSATLASVLAGLSSPTGLKRRTSEKFRGSAPFNKHLKIDEVRSSQMPAACCNERREVPSQLLDTSDLECSLCMRLFYDPVTTPCGHTFCLKCLERCLDHNPICPLCKDNIAEYRTTRGCHKTLLMEEVLQHYLSEELAERSTVHKEEMTELSNLTKEVPIFICTVAFPTITCPLHIFEPCYRLMIRRSVETGTKRFGMCIADSVKGFADYGCMLEVKDMKFYPDGGSVVIAVGVSRFKVLSHGHRDGYSTAEIVLLEDQKVEGEELAELRRLHDSVYDQACAWFTSLKENIKNQIVHHFGQLPGKDPDMQWSPNGPAWCWWLLAVLPLEQRAQLSILAMTTLRDRLSATRRVLILVARKLQKPPSTAASASL